MSLNFNLSMQPEMTVYVKRVGTTNYRATNIEVNYNPYICI